MRVSNQKLNSERWKTPALRAISKLLATYWQRKQKRRGAPRRKCLILMVEQRGIEPLTSALRTRRSAKLSYCPTGKTILPFRVSSFKFRLTHRRRNLRRSSFQTFLPTEMALVRGRRSLDVWFHSEHRSKHAPKQSCSLRLRLAPALLPAKLIADQARADSGKVQPHLPANRSAHRLAARLIVNRTPAVHHIDILRQ